ncbi:MAG: trypsin-like peptidase domain-containing protein [Gemmatimonadota bacterium]|nr:trypsin-like peptidase domain-containing protein [Gemmatimonadota bacterium]
MTRRGELLVTAVLVAAVAAGAGWWLGADDGGGLERALSESAHAQTPEGLDASRRNAIVAAADRVGPAVVSVSVVSTQVVRDRSPFEDPFFRGFEFLFPPRERLRRVQGLGSGFVVSHDGYVVTNQHVVAGATRIVVTLLDGRQFSAELVSEDPATDLAVLKIDAEDLPVAPLGDSGDLLIGEWAIAIGNPFGYLLADRRPSVTVGVISAIGRDVRPQGGAGRGQVWSNMIQTDAAINPGNSGGPLVNAHGEVVGVNAFIFSGDGGGSIGLGFAIPIDRVRRVLSDVVAFGEIRRPWTGVHLVAPPAEEGRAPRGARVVKVDPGSPADRAGIRPGDRIVATDGRPLDSPIEWEGRLLDLPSEESLTVEIERDPRGAEEAIRFEVEVRPEDDPVRRAPRASVLGATFLVLDATIASRLDVESERGLYLLDLHSRSPLHRLDLREGDVLIAVDSHRLEDTGDADRLEELLRSGRRGSVLLERDGREGRITVF